MAHSIVVAEEEVAPANEVADIARWAAKRHIGLVWGTNPQSTHVRVARVRDGKAVVVDLWPAQAKIGFVLEQAVASLDSHYFGENGLSPNLGTLSDIWWPRALVRMVFGEARIRVRNEEQFDLYVGKGLNERQVTFFVPHLDSMGMAYLDEQLKAAEIDYFAGPCFDGAPDVVLDTALVIEHADAIFGSE